MIALWLLLLSASASAQSNDDLLPPPGGYEQPMVHMGQSVYGQLMADRLEYRLTGKSSEVGVDIEGWLGSDRGRFRYRLEGDHALSASEGEGEVSLLYGRLFAPFWEIQLGARGVGAREGDENGGEISGFVGIEGTIPYDFEFESGLYIGHRGRVSLSAEIEKEFLFTQRLVLHLRAESEVSSKNSTALDSRWGLNAQSAGVRLRYEFHRQFAPYVGFRYTLTPSPPSESFAVEGQPWFVAGLRLWL